MHQVLGRVLRNEVSNVMDGLVEGDQEVYLYRFRVMLVLPLDLLKAVFSGFSMQSKNKHTMPSVL
jgi:hypothetical protein